MEVPAYCALCNQPCVIGPLCPPCADHVNDPEEDDDDEFP